MQALGDLAQGLVLRARLGEIKSLIQTRSGELTTGLAADRAKHLGADLGLAASLERSLIALEAYRITSIETEELAGAMQRALGVMQDTAMQSASNLVTAELHLSEGAITAMAQNADAALATVVANLNLTQMGRTVFAGAATDRAAVLDVSTLKDLVRSELSGLSSIGDIRSALDVWFHSAGGGFEEDYYNGAEAPLAEVQLSDTQSAQLTIKADEVEIRNVLKELTLAAVADDPALGFESALKTDLLKSAGEALVSGQVGLTETRAELGALEERIALVRSANASAKTATELALSNILGIDEFDSATRLEEAQFQLESLYAITARSARLNLVNYLR